jgi:beta-glucosidase
MMTKVRIISGRLIPLAVVCCFFAGCVTNVSPDDVTSLIPKVEANDPAVTPVPRTDPAVQDGWWMARHNQVVQDFAKKKNYDFIFIGDSITHEWETNSGSAWSEMTAKYSVKNLGFGGDSTQHVIWRLKNGEFPEGLRPKYVIIMIGANNAGNSPNSTAAGIGEIVQIVHKTSPAARIILMSILPRGTNFQEFLRRNCESVNKILATWDGYSHITYFDLARFFVNDDKTIQTHLFREDRLHLSVAGYGVWKEKILQVTGKL